MKQRGNDILQLFDHFLEYFGMDMDFSKPAVEEKAKEILLNYKYPGKVRELRNVVQQCELLFSQRRKVNAKSARN